MPSVGQQLQRVDTLCKFCHSSAHESGLLCLGTTTKSFVLVQRVVCMVTLENCFMFKYSCIIYKSMPLVPSLTSSPLLILFSTHIISSNALSPPLTGTISEVSWAFLMAWPSEIFQDAVKVILYCLPELFAEPRDGSILLALITPLLWELA